MIWKIDQENSNTNSLFVFSVLTSFSLNFNFSSQIKSLFIFSDLTSFFIVLEFPEKRGFPKAVKWRALPRMEIAHTKILNFDRKRI